MCLRIFIAMQFNSKNYLDKIHILAREEMNKFNYSPNDCYTAIRKNKILPHITVQMKLQSIILYKNCKNLEVILNKITFLGLK